MFSMTKGGLFMRKGRVMRIFVFCLVAMFVFAWSDTLVAQGKKGKGKKESGKGKKTEQKVDKEKGKKLSGVDSLKVEGKKNRYKPRKLKKEDDADWEDGTPPGWSKGKKTGWGDEGAPPGQIKKLYPPGSEGWDEKKKEEYDKGLEDAKARVRERVRQRSGATTEDEQSAVRSVEEASRRGVPVKRIETTVKKAMERGMKSEEIEKVTRAMTYGSDKNVDYGKLGSFVDKGIEEGKDGDELATSIYKKIDSGTLEKKAEEKRSWWRRIFKRD